MEQEEFNTEYVNDRETTFVRQEGGDHYQTEYQHWDWVQEAGIGYLVGNATKYLSRWRKKNGIQDLLKARTYLEKIIATRHLPSSKFHYHENTFGYTTRVLTEKFIQSNNIPPDESEIIWILTGPCTVEMVGLALERLDELIGTAQNAAGKHGG